MAGPGKRTPVVSGVPQREQLELVSDRIQREAIFSCIITFFLHFQMLWLDMNVSAVTKARAGSQREQSSQTGRRHVSEHDCEDGHLTGLFLKGVQHITGHLCLHLCLQLCHLHLTCGLIYSFFQRWPRTIELNHLVACGTFLYFLYIISETLLVPVLLLF